MSHAMLITNPNSRQGETLREEIEAALKGLGVTFIHSGPCSDSKDIARMIEKHSPDRIIAAGGDGTVKCAAEALIGKNIPLGIIPAGTANNVSRTLQIPQNVQEACAIIARGKTVAIDVARVNGHTFISVAGIGISTDVHKSVDPKIKRHFGPFAYALEAFRSLRQTQGFRYELKTETQTLHGKAIQLTICNGKNFGGVIEVGEGASLSDLKLHGLIIEHVRWFQGMMRAILNKKGKGIRRFTAQRIEIRTWPNQPLDIEGTVLGTTPAVFDLLPSAVRIFVPEAAIQELKDLKAQAI